MLLSSNFPQVRQITTGRDAEFEERGNYRSRYV